MDTSKTYFGFTDNMIPRLKAKTENTLDKLIRSEGKVMTEKEWIFIKLQNGFKPDVIENYSYYSSKTREMTKPKTLYKIEGDGFYNEVNKTLYDYAVYIVENGFTDVLKVERYIATEQAQKEAEAKQQAERESQEKAEREEQRKKDEEEKQAKKVKRWTEIQNIILSFTDEEMSRINAITDYIRSEYADLLSDNNYTTMILEYDIMRIVALDKRYPESAIDSVKYYRDLIDPNSKNYNRNNQHYIRQRKVDNDIRNMFFGITDAMPSQTVRALLQGEITAQEAQDRVTKNKQRKAAQEDKLVTFYRLVRVEGNGTNFIEDKGEKVVVDGFTLYGLMFNEEYNLIEEQTGMSFTRGRNKTEAIAKLKESIAKHGREAIERNVEQTKQRYGVSPMLQHTA